jgi:UDP-glucose 4-epimerase
MILITGTSGFLGTKLLNVLIQEYGSEGILPLTSKPIPGQRVLIHNGYDFNDDFFVQSGYDTIHTIIHLGAFTPKNGKEANDWRGSNSNIISTDRLLKAKMPNLKKFIYLSTIDVYGEDRIISETSTLSPISLYGLSKLYCEKAAESWANIHKIQFQLLRIGHVYGPGEENYQKLIPNTMKKLLSGDAIQIFGTGFEIRSFIYVDDVIRAIQQILRLVTVHGPINIVGGRSKSVIDLIKDIIRISGKTPKIEQNDANIKSRDLIFDNSKMINILNIEETNLEEGLRTEWEYMTGLYK